MGRLLNTRRGIEHIADSAYSEALKDAMEDTRVSLEDIGSDIDEETKRALMFGIVCSQAEATSAFTIHRRSPIIPHQDLRHQEGLDL